jgi:hypothetical protein
MHATHHTLQDSRVSNQACMYVCVSPLEKNVNNVSAPPQHLRCRSTCVVAALALRWHARWHSTRAPAGACAMSQLKPAQRPRRCGARCAAACASPQRARCARRRIVCGVRAAAAFAPPYHASCSSVGAAAACRSARRISVRGAARAPPFVAQQRGALGLAT